MNKFVGIGNLVRDAELRFTTDGKAVAKFTIAINDGYGDKKRVDYLNCVAFGKTAEATANYTFKGSKVAVDGKIQTGSYKNKDGKTVYTTDIIVNNIEFLTKKEQGLGDDTPEVFQPVDDEDIPF